MSNTVVVNTNTPYTYTHKNCVFEFGRGSMYVGGHPTSCLVVYKYDKKDEYGRGEVEAVYADGVWRIVTNKEEKCCCHA